MMATARRSTIYLDADLHRQIRLAGADGDRTISELVNAAVAHFLAAGAPTGGVTDTSAGPAAAESRAAAAPLAAAPTVVAGTAAPGRPTVALPAFAAPAAAPPAGLAPPVRRLFGALRPADADLAVAQAARLGGHVG